MSAASESLPLVSCLMVTANRSALCHRAVRCFLKQTYPNRELVVIDDGTEDLSEALQEVPSDRLVYVKLERKPESVLGSLRNRSLEEARGEILAQWDDDDWYHPERLERQVRPVLEGSDACILSGSLMHLDTPAFNMHPYVGYLKGGVPGSIVHRREDAIRYPALRRAEDSIYLDAWRDRALVQLGAEEAHLFIRCFHGNNTWEATHFTRRIRNSPTALLAYGWHRYVRGDLFGHPRFRLDRAAEQSFRMFLEDSAALGLVPAPVS